MKHRLRLRKDSRETQTEDKPQRAVGMGRTPREASNTDTLGESGTGAGGHQDDVTAGRPGSKGLKRAIEAESRTKAFPRSTTPSQEETAAPQCPAPQETT